MGPLGSPDQAGVQNVGPIGSSDDIEEFKDINFDINVIDQTQHIEPGQIKMEKGTCVQARIVEENVLGSYPLFVKNEVKSQKTELPQKVDEKLPEEKSCSTPNPVGESSDGHKDEKTVDGGNLCDVVEQDSPIGRKSLMQITGEFPR